MTTDNDATVYNSCVMLCDDQETFIDSRGAVVEMPDVISALLTVEDLARDSIPDDTDIAFGDRGLSSMRGQLLTACDTLGAFTRQVTEIDVLVTPNRYAEGDLAVGEDDDPATVSGAIAHCLAAANSALPDPMGVHGIEEAEEHDQKTIAIDFVQAFLAANRTALMAWPVSEPAALAP